MELQTFKMPSQGVDFEPLHGPQDVLSQFPWEPQQGGGLEPPERPRGTL